MGTTYHITLVTNTKVATSQQAIQMQIDKTLENVNQVMSTYIGDSELSLLNQAPSNEWIVISESLFYVLSEGQKVSDATAGAFDITVGPLVNLWGFGPDKELVDIPSDKTIEETRKTVGSEYIELNGDTRQVRKSKDVYIDLSAIAKGYGADTVAKLVVAHGFNDFMIEIGGELNIQGNSPRGVSWVIGVEKPSLAHTGSMQAVSIDKGGMATSGDYRNYYEKDGVRVSHTIDPETGKPITHKLASVTVIAENGCVADAYATALNVMGPDKAMDFAKANNMAAFFIIRTDDKGQESYATKHSPEFSRYIKK